MESSKMDRTSSSLAGLCLFLSVLFLLVTGMILCACPGIPFIAVVFAGLAFWRGTTNQRILAVLLLLFGGYLTVTQAMEEYGQTQRARAIRNQQLQRLKGM
jgi:hypothetical protein